jgi:hypothetical protein
MSYCYKKQTLCTLFSTDVDPLCGQVVRVPGYGSRDPGFDFRHYQIFWEVVGLERGPRSLVIITEELLEWKSSGSRPRKSRLTAVGIRCTDHAAPSIRKSGHWVLRQAAVTWPVQFPCGIKLHSLVSVLMCLVGVLNGNNVISFYRYIPEYSLAF